MPLKSVSPPWMTFALRKKTTTSPSVCAGGTWTASTSSPFTWNETDSANVTSGSAAAGEAGVVRLNSLMNCSTDIRLRTFSCATMTAPRLAEVLVPAHVVAVPVRVQDEADRLGRRAAIAALILSVSGAYWSSTRKTPSGPARDADVAAGAGEHPEAVGDLFGLDLDLAEVLLGGGGDSETRRGQRERVSFAWEYSSRKKTSNDS